LSKRRTVAVVGTVGSRRFQPRPPIQGFSAFRKSSFSPPTVHRAPPCAGGSSALSTGARNKFCITRRLRRANLYLLCFWHPYGANAKREIQGRHRGKRWKWGSETANLFGAFEFAFYFALPPYFTLFPPSCSFSLSFPAAQQEDCRSCQLLPPRPRCSAPLRRRRTGAGRIP